MLSYVKSSPLKFETELKRRLNLQTHATSGFGGSTSCTTSPYNSRTIDSKHRNCVSSKDGGSQVSKDLIGICQDLGEFLPMWTTFWGGSLSSAASSQQAAGSGSQQLFCAQTTSTGPLQTYHRKSTISGAAAFLLINNCMCFGVTKPPPTQQNVNQSRISPYESQALIGGNDGLHSPWAVGNWIHSGTADGSDIHPKLSS